MFKIHKGTSRIALIVFSLLVIKIPRIWANGSQYAWGNIKHHWSEGGVKRVWEKRLLRKLFRRMLQDFFLGLCANITEGWVSLDGKVEFVQSSYCLIFCNLQWYAGDRIPTAKELKPFFDSLPEKARSYLHCLDPHQYAWENWRIVDNRLRLIDYGGKLYDSASFTHLLLRWGEEISKQLVKPII